MKPQGGRGRKPGGRGGHPPQRGGAAKKSSGKPKSTKNQIRDLERLLKKPDLDAKMRGRLEAKLEELRGAAAEVARKELERKYALRYHKVRFFERVKLERRLARLQARLAGAEQGGGGGGAAAADVGALRAQLAAVREDLQYVQHFPKGEKYVSLLRDAEEPEAQARLESERARLRALVKRQLAEAAMLAEADEGAGLAAGAATPALAKATPDAGTAADKEAGEDDDFFLGSDEEEGAVAAPAAAAGGKRKFEEAAGSGSGEEESEEEEEAGVAEEASSGDEGGFGAQPSSGEDASEASEGGEDEGSSDEGAGGGGSSEDDEERQQPLQQQRRQQQADGRPGQPKAGRAAAQQGKQPWKQQQGGGRGQGGRGGGRGTGRGGGGGRGGRGGRDGSAREPWTQQGRGGGSGGRGSGAPWKQAQQGDKPRAPAGGRGKSPQQQKRPQQASGQPKPGQPAEKQPVRTRAEGGRKRRKKKD